MKNWRDIRKNRVSPVMEDRINKIIRRIELNKNKVTLQIVTQVNQDGLRNQTVITNNQAYSVDYTSFKEGDRGLSIPEGALIPLSLAKMMVLHRTKAIEDKENEGYYRSIEDIILPVAQLFPRAPYKPGTRESVDLSKESDDDFAYLLKIKFKDPEEYIESEDEFSLDDDAFVILETDSLDISDEIEESVDLPPEERELLDVIAMTHEALQEVTKEDREKFSQILDTLESEDEND